MPTDFATTVDEEVLPWANVAQQIMPEILENARLASRARQVSERDIAKQLLLHLPRFAPDQLVVQNLISREAARLANKLETLRSGFSTWAEHPRLEHLDKSELVAQECSDNVADDVYTRFHYIGTLREAIVHLGVYVRDVPNTPMALASLSEMDITALDKYFPSSAARKTALVVSRVFAFDWAPRNSISFLLGRLAQWVLKYRPEVRVLLTHLNPNLGFNGASYLAANWSPFTEVPARYLYFGDDYITYRSFAVMPARVKATVRASVCKLEPLLVLRYQMNR
jgi:hypothetical protein